MTTKATSPIAIFVLGPSSFVCTICLAGAAQTWYPSAIRHDADTGRPDDRYRRVAVRHRLERPMPCAALDIVVILHRNPSMLLCVILLRQRHTSTELRMRHR